MGKTKRGRKAEISTAFLVTVILLIIGLVILMVFFYNVNNTGTITNTICHNSVIYRATLPTLFEDYIPLKCQTNKICIIPGGLKNVFSRPNCTEYEGEQGINYVRVKNIQQIEKLYAQETVSCWEMMGEGKLSLFTQYGAKTFGLGRVYPSCVICSRVAFSDKLTLDLSQMDVPRYMLENKMPGKNITYFEYVASENGKVAIKDGLNSEIPTGFKEGKDDLERTIVEVAKDDKGLLIVDKIKTEDLTQENIAAQDAKFAKAENAILFMQISSPTQGGSALNIGKALIGTEVGAFALAPKLTWKANTIAVRACTSSLIGAGICSALVAIATIGQQSNVAYNRGLTAGKCGDVSIGTEARNGCSVVRVANYDVADISSYCSMIESIP